jgi:hypothetical protein
MAENLPLADMLEVVSTVVVFACLADFRTCGKTGLQKELGNRNLDNHAHSAL